MSSSGIHTQHIQRRVIRTLLVIAALVLAIAVPLVVFDDLRLDVAYRLHLVPGADAEQLADADDGAVLIVVPLGDYQGVGRERYGYRADYIARPSESGMALTDIETQETVDIPLRSLDHIATDPDGEHLLFRGASDDGESAVVLATETNTFEVLQEGQATPDLPGDWETPTWEKIVGRCDRFSPDMKYVACFNRADAASYLAGDWQVDVQVYGDFDASEPVYRGIGFLPSLGFAHDDTWLYFQNETGIYRIEIPESLQEQQASATPQG